MPARRKEQSREIAVADTVLETQESSLLDLVDHLLNKGVVATGDVMLGVAGIDLIYLRLSAVLCAADRVLPPEPDRPARGSRHGRHRGPMKRRRA